MYIHNNSVRIGAMDPSRADRHSDVASIRKMRFASRPRTTAHARSRFLLNSVHRAAPR